jgi:hypothetical protein
MSAIGETMKKIILGLALLVGSAGAQVSNPSIILVASAPSGACLVNLPDYQVITLGTIYTCQSGTWTLIGSGGGGSSAFNAITSGTNTSAAMLLGTGSSLGTTGEGTLYASNAALNIVPVEQFGAVADYPGPGGGTGTGTDNTTAIQACINYVQTTLGSGQCLLKKGNYRITAPILITKSGVGIAGSAYGAGSINISNQLAANAPLSALYIDSATADAIDVNASGSLGAPVSFNKFNDFTIMRTKAASASGTGCPLGPAGLSIQFAGGFVVDRVWSEDSACNFYFQNAGAYGTGYVSNSGSTWAANGFNPAITIAGFYYNGLNSAESFRLRDSFSAILFPGFTGVTSYGFYAKGAQLNDFFLRGFETSFQSYGEYFQYTGSGTGVQASDIHIIDAVNDTDYLAGIFLTGIPAVAGGNVEIKGGWDSAQTSGSKGIDIESSSGVTVSNVLISESGTFGSGAIGIKAANSSRVAINNNNILSAATNAIQLSTVTDSTVTGNVLSSISAFPTPTFISATGVTYSAITGNTISGFGGVGLSFDSTSSNNRHFNSIDPTNITTQVVDQGTNDFSPTASWPPSAATPTFSPVAGSVSPGTTVTATCTFGSPFVSLGTTAVAGGTGVSVSTTGPVYGSCQGSGYFTTGVAYYSTSLGTIYVNTTFNELTSGNLLAGSTPATCTSGCTGTWTAASGGPSSGAWTYGTNSVSLTGVCTAGGPDVYCPVYINHGQTTYAARTTVSSVPTSTGIDFVMAWTNNTNFVTFQCGIGTGGIALFDVVGGTATNETLTPSGTGVACAAIGSFRVTKSGNTYTITPPSGITYSGTVSGTNAATTFGFNEHQSSGSFGTWTITAFEVSQN